MHCDKEDGKGEVIKTHLFCVVVLETGGPSSNRCRHEQASCDTTRKPSRLVDLMECQYGVPKASKWVTKETYRE